MVQNSFEILSQLAGIFKGEGSGQFPTIKPFDYRETIRFERSENKEILHYEQKTWLKPDDDPTHWESGFLIVEDDGSIKMLNSQNSGRVEVLTGIVEVTGNGFRLELNNIQFGNDPRMIKARRVLTLEENVFSYEVLMATTTTEKPDFLPHLQANLNRLIP